MKAKLLKQIRRKYEIKVFYNTSSVKYMCKNIKTGEIYKYYHFDLFIMHIGNNLGRFYEFLGYVKKYNYKREQYKLRKEYETN